MKSFYDVPEGLVRGSYVFGFTSTSVYFGSIQGINLSKKAILFGVEVFEKRSEEQSCVKDINNPEMIWMPQWTLANNEEDFKKLLLTQHLVLREKADELIIDLNKLDWYVNLHARVEFYRTYRA